MSEPPWLSTRSTISPLTANARALLRSVKARAFPLLTESDTARRAVYPTNRTSLLRTGDAPWRAACQLQFTQMSAGALKDRVISSAGYGRSLAL
jgi:hypothetical protein